MPEDALERMGRFLKDARVDRHLTQDQLAEAAGISKRYLTDIERGKKNPSYLVLLQLFMILQVSFEPLFYPAMTKNESNEAKLLAIFRRCDQAEQTFVLRTLDFVVNELVQRREADM